MKKLILCGIIALASGSLSAQTKSNASATPQRETVSESASEKPQQAKAKRQELTEDERNDRAKPSSIEEVPAQQTTGQKPVRQQSPVQRDDQKASSADQKPGPVVQKAPATKEQSIELTEDQRR